MYNKLIALSIVIASLSINSVFAGGNYDFTSANVNPVNNVQYNQQSLNYNQNSPLKGSVVMVPAGTLVPAMLTAPLSSTTSFVGQSVTMILNSDFYYGNKLIAPAGSSVIGTVVEADRAKRGSINGKLCVRFTQMMTPYGNQIPISALIKTDDGTGVLRGGTKLDVTKEYTKDLVAGSAAGALSGVVFGALAGGNVGRGAALGTAVGAGGGLVKSVWDKGVNVDIPANASIDLMLTQPITVSSSNYSYEN